MDESQGLYRQSVKGSSGFDGRIDRLSQIVPISYRHPFSTFPPNMPLPTSVQLLHLLLCCFCIRCSLCLSSSDERVANTFPERVERHNNIVLGTPSADRGPLEQLVLAHQHVLPLDEHPLQELLDEVGRNSTNSDFAIVVLTRLLFFTARSTSSEYYDNLILPKLQSEHYWYTKEKGVVNDDTMNSENHMILWMSSSWLLQERNQWDLKDATLTQRLVHFLNLKISYGYYEFLSMTYLPFTFSALLNLVDFSKDLTIRDLADRALRRLVSDYLLFVNEKGVHYTAAGRDYAERFLEPAHTQDLDGFIYLITGMGELKREAISLSCFLSTSTIDFREEMAQWQPSIDTTYTYGHTIEESLAINANLGKYDRIVFQFSQGAYAHPVTVKDTVDFFRHFGPIRLKEHVAMDGKYLPSGNVAGPMAKLLDRLTVGSVWSGNSIQLYRQAGSMLTSVDNFWPGYVGGQTFPWMAVAGDVPVWTQSGLVKEKWLDKDGTLTNSHLPFVKQEGNVALITYKPHRAMPLSLFGDVALSWQEDRFNETRTVRPLKTQKSPLLTALWEMKSSGDSQRGSWILGRRDESYVAIYRPCGDKKFKGWFACSGVMGRQVWAAVVGDASRYGSFENFANVIETATVEEAYQWRLLRKPVYTTSITVEATSIVHHW